MEQLKALIAGGGIGGMAAALACARAGFHVDLLESAPAFTEIGAGVQLGPNITRILQGWGLQQALQKVAAYPETLQARCGLSAALLSELPLGKSIAAHYDAPYVTILRSDLHDLLSQAVHHYARVKIHHGCTVTEYRQLSNHVQLLSSLSAPLEGQLLIVADGIWSRLREQMLDDGVPRISSQMAYRAIVPQKALPQHLRSQQLVLWMAPGLHIVQYPVRCGELLNVVIVARQHIQEGWENWDHAATMTNLHMAMADVCSHLQDMMEAIGRTTAWRLWALCDRPVLARASQMARAQVALLGDAAHPMLPHLAQGAGMAIEDASELERQLQKTLPILQRADAPLIAAEIRSALQLYGQRRWLRAAQTHLHSQRMGSIFQASGPLRLARNIALRMMGPYLMDQPWLFDAKAQRP